MNIVKHARVLLAVVLLCAAIFHVQASAAEILHTGTCGTELTWSLDDAGQLTITGSGAIDGFTDGTAPWYEHRERIHTLVLEEGITHIGTYAFQNCAFLTKITIPVSVAALGDSAFAGCTALKTVHYAGTGEQWNALTVGIDNQELTRAYTQSICQHTWDAGVETLPATCKDEGQMTFTCTLCSAVDVQSIPVTGEHVFDVWQRISTTQHKRVCSVCAVEEIASHSWGRPVVLQPITCGQVGIEEFTCTDCGEVKNVIYEKSNNHKYDNSCDAVCNICDAVRRTTHQYDTQWSQDETSHWHACTVCGEKTDTEAHIWDNNDVCVHCDMENPNPHVHDFGTVWYSDEDSHWQQCDCGESTAAQSHSWDEDSVCSVCGFALPEPTRPSTPPTEAPTEPMETPTIPDYGDYSEPFSELPMIIAGVVMLLSGAGLVLFIILGKKKPT